MSTPVIQPAECLAKLKDGAWILTAIDDVLCVIFDGRNEEAAKRFINLKSEIDELEYSVLIDSDARLNKVVSTVPSIAWDLMDTATKPLILLLSGGQQISKSLLNHAGQLAIRKVIDDTTVQWMRRWPIPLAAMPLIDEDGFPAGLVEEGEPVVLEAVDYILNLPDPNRTYVTKTIPIISLGAENEVKIVRS